MMKLWMDAIDWSVTFDDLAELAVLEKEAESWNAGKAEYYHPYTPDEKARFDATFLYIKTSEALLLLLRQIYIDADRPVCLMRPKIVSKRGGPKWSVWKSVV